MKQAAALLLLLLICLAVPAAAVAQEDAGQDLQQELGQSVEEMLGGMDFEAWDDLLGQEGESARALVESLADGTFRSDPQGWLSRITQRLFTGIRDMLGQMALVIGLSVLGGVLARVSENGGTVSDAAQLLCFVLSAVALVSGFGLLVAQAVKAVDAIVDFAGVLLPPLLALLTALGAPASAGAFQPLVGSLTFLCTAVIKGFLVGLILLCAALCLIRNLGTGLQTDSILKLLKTVCSWTLGVLLGIYSAALLVQGVATATLDGVSLRTAKYAIDNFLPVVGGVIADSFDTLVGCCLIVKNAVGVAGLLWVLYLLLQPVLSLAAAIGAYRLSAALLQTVGASRTVGLLEDFASVLSLLLAAVASCALLLILLIAAVLSGGGMVTMLR